MLRDFVRRGKVHQRGIDRSVRKAKSKKGKRVNAEKHLKKGAQQEGNYSSLKRTKPP